MAGSGVLSSVYSLWHSLVKNKKNRLLLLPDLTHFPGGEQANIAFRHHLLCLPFALPFWEEFPCHAYTIFGMCEKWCVSSISLHWRLKEEGRRKQISFSCLPPGNREEELFWVVSKFSLLMPPLCNFGMPACPALYLPSFSRPCLSGTNQACLLAFHTPLLEKQRQLGHPKEKEKEQEEEHCTPPSTWQWEFGQAWPTSTHAPAFCLLLSSSLCFALEAGDRISEVRRALCRRTDLWTPEAHAHACMRAWLTPGGRA